MTNAEKINSITNINRRSNSLTSSTNLESTNKRGYCPIVPEKVISEENCNFMTDAEPGTWFNKDGLNKGIHSIGGRPQGELTGL